MEDLITMWFDKDGVLAVYDYSLYESECDLPAPWLIRNAHVFRNLETYRNMCQAFSRLYKENANKSIRERRCNVRVLTAVSDSATLSEQVIDSAYWCEKYLGLKAKDFYACAVSKETVPITLRNRITRKDVLFDDYMPNLRKWKEAGGTAIKVINGINSGTTEFPFIFNGESTSYLYKTFRLIIDTLDRGEELACGEILNRK